jgi:hypothetical protein
MPLFTGCTVFTATSDEVSLELTSGTSDHKENKRFIEINSLTTDFFL